MKILLTDLGNAVAAQGGVEKVLADMANEMQRRGHDVTVMIFDKRDGSLYFPLNEGVKFCNPGVGVHHNRILVNLVNVFVRDKNKRQINSFLHSAKVIAKKIKPIIDDISPDIVIGFEAISAIVFSNPEIKHFPFIQMFHFSPKTVLTNRYLHRYYENADCLQVLMQNDIGFVESCLYPKKIVWIPNIVPQYSEICDYQSKTIISVGRLDRAYKRQEILIKAFKQLSDDYNQWNVEIWGDKYFDREYYQELNNYVVTEHLENRVLFMGMTQHIYKKLQRASIFAFPSFDEGFPLAMTEAMSMGLPVVACGVCNAVNKIVRHEENGLLCEEGIDAFAEGLKILMDSVSLRTNYGKHGKECMQQYSAGKIWNTWENIMETTLAEYCRDK